MDGLLAANKPNILDERLLWATGALVAVLFGAAAVIHFLQRWRDRQVAGGPGPEADPLTAYREMYLRGELTKEEYQRIRAKVAAEHYAVGKKPSPAESADSPPPPEPPPDGAA
ncbi:MAG TPA: SHOCT domain-containing protein [Gemmataceae bacterium]